MNYRERFDELKKKYKYWEVQRVEYLLEQLEERERNEKNKERLEANIEALQSIYRNSGINIFLKRTIAKSIEEMERIRKKEENSLWEKQEEKLKERMESLLEILEGK